MKRTEDVRAGRVVVIQKALEWFGRYKGQLSGEAGSVILVTGCFHGR
jgi:hypothetical protein